MAPLFGEPVVAKGWAATFAVDIAFGYFVAIVIFRRHPAVPFFLLIALSSNVVGFAALAPAATADQAAAGDSGRTHGCGDCRRGSDSGGAGTRSFWPYLLAGGGLSWLALILGGVHPALALVPIVPFMPHAARDPGFLVDAPTTAHDTLERIRAMVPPPRAGGPAALRARDRGRPRPRPR